MDKTYKSALFSAISPAGSFRFQRAICMKLNRPVMVKESDGEKPMNAVVIGGSLRSGGCSTKVTLEGELAYFEENDRVEEEYYVFGGV